MSMAAEAVSIQALGRLQHDAKHNAQQIAQKHASPPPIKAKPLHDTHAYTRDTTNMGGDENIKKKLTSSSLYPAKRTTTGSIQEGLPTLGGATAAADFQGSAAAAPNRPLIAPQRHLHPHHRRRRLLPRSRPRGRCYRLLHAPFHCSPRELTEQIRTESRCRRLFAARASRCYPYPGARRQAVRFRPHGRHHSRRYCRVRWRSGSLPWRPNRCR